MSPLPQPGELVAALDERVTTALSAVDVGGLDGEPATRLRRLLTAARDGESRTAWLAFIALTGTFPDADRLGRLRRALALSSEPELVSAALEATVSSAGRPAAARRRIELVTDPGVLIVDVTFCASNQHNTGIQRVVRSFLPHWVTAGKPVRLVRWAPDGGGYVDLDEAERRRVLEWGSGEPVGGERARTAPAQRRVVVPWGVDVFFPEVPYIALEQLACLAGASGNGVAMLGYDTIPIVSADLLPAAEPERFAKYLEIVKRSRLVIGISRSAAAEFAGFASALPAQGLTGPRVTAVSLATQTPVHESRTDAPADALPVVLCVGSHEPRKNQDAVLTAARVLYDEGLEFRMVFVGGGSRQATARFDAEVRELAKQGRAVESHRRLGDTELWGLYRTARFTVLLSLHEGFGLPIVESTSLGTPVLTSNFGSLAEVAGEGGCLMVDPRDDEQVIDGMRRMLSDDALLDRLRDEITRLGSRSWGEYAQLTWQELRGAAA